MPLAMLGHLDGDSEKGEAFGQDLGTGNDVVSVALDQREDRLSKSKAWRLIVVVSPTLLYSFSVPRESLSKLFSHQIFQVGKETTRTFVT